MASENSNSEVALALARIEGKLDATLPELSEKHRRVDATLETLHGRTSELGRKVAGHAERIEDLEERSKGQLGRAATIVAIAGGLVGLLSAILPAIAPAI